MSLRQLLVWLLVAALVVTGIAWFLKNFEQVTEKVSTGFRGEALRNPWLAAQRLSERMGATAIPILSPPDLRELPESATLVLPARRQTLTESLRLSLITWVMRGGHLVVEAEPAGQADPLLDNFGVVRTQVKFDPAEARSDKPFEIRLPGHDQPTRVLMSKWEKLDAQGAFFRFDGGKGHILLILGRGKGRVVVLSDLHFASNAQIGAHEHAKFFWEIAAPPDAGDIYFFNRPGKLSLSEWLQDHAWAPLGSLAALVLLWLWSVAPRFGPVAPDPERSRRRLLDHLRASGRFLWSNGGAQRMLEAARDACLRRIGRAHPDFLAVPEAERPQRLTELLGWPADRAQRLLAPAAAGRMLDFMDTVALYQSVHEHLALKARASRRT